MQQAAAREGAGAGEAVPVVHGDGVLLDERPLRRVARLHAAWAWHTAAHDEWVPFCETTCAGFSVTVDHARFVI